MSSNYSKSSIGKRWIFLVLPHKFSNFLFRSLLSRKNEQNKLEAAKFAELVILAYGSKFYFSNRFLKFPFELGQINIDKDSKEHFFNSVITLRRQPERRKQISLELKKTIEGISKEQLDAQSWKLFSLILTGFGFIRAGTIARQNFIDVAISEANRQVASSRTLHQLIRGLLESQRFKEACYYITTFSKSLDISNTNNPYDDYLSLLKHPRQLLEDSEQITKSKNEIIYEDLIRNKSVALVATGEIRSDSGYEIDSMDTVARVKFQGLAIMPNKKFAGTRCDISLYTEDLVTKFMTKSKNDPQFLNFLKSTKIIVLKQKSEVQIDNIRTHNLGYWAPTFLTTATSGTLFIFDIARQSPSKIKLFGFNFYTQRNLYNSALLKFYDNKGSLRDIGLPKNWFKFSSNRKNSAIIAAGFLSHDPRSDFLLVKNLYELSGLIDGTPEVLEILNLTADEYDARLEEMLGDW